MPRVRSNAVRLRKSDEFSIWLESLDNSAYARIVVKLQRIEAGNPGDCKQLGDGLFEYRIHFGPGYRIYACLDSDEQGTLTILLGGGDKGSQQKDILKARELMKELKNDS